MQVYPRALSRRRGQHLYGSGGDITTGTLTTTWTRDKRGLPTAMTDPDGAVTSYAYDQAGQHAVTTVPPVTTQVDGGPAGDRAPGDDDRLRHLRRRRPSRRTPNGKITTYRYDADGRQLSQALPSYTQPGASTVINAVDSTAYDGAGLVHVAPPTATTTPSSTATTSSATRSA